VAVAAEGEKEHVWRGVDGTQAAIDVERARRQVLSETLRDHNLERVATEDVLPRGIDHGVELALGHVGFPAAAVGPVRSHRNVVGCQPLFHLVDAGDRVGIVLAIRPVDREQPKAPRHVVEDRQVLGAKKRRLGHRRRGAGGGRKALEVPRGFVTEVSHRAAVEPGNSRHRGFGGHGAQRGQGIAVAQLELPRLVSDE